MHEDRLFSFPFLLCFAANMAQGIAFNLYLHFPGFLKELGAEEVEIGLISSLTAVAAIGARPWVGRTMDLRGRRPVILIGGSLNVLVCALYLTVTGIGPWVYGIRVVHGLGEAMLFASLFTYAADFVPARRRTEGLALFGVSGMLPISLGGLLGDALLARFDYGALFQASLAFAVLSLLLSFPLRDVRRTAGAGEPSRPFTEVALQRDQLPLWFIGTIFSTALAAVFIFLKTFVLETGIGSVGLFFSTYTGAALVLRVFFGWLPDRIGPKRVLFPALVVLSLGFLLLAGARDVADVAWAGLLCGAGHGYTFPILFGMVVTRARDSERGAAMSVFTALFDAGILIGGPLFGAVIDVGGYPAMYLCAALVTALGTGLFALLDRR
jgi:MFS family permease